MLTPVNPTSAMDLTSEKMNTPSSFEKDDTIGSSELSTILII